MWRLYYHVPNVFMGYIKTHKPHKAIPNVCVLPECHWRSRAPIHDNNVGKMQRGYSIYQHDNAPRHMGQIVREWLEVMSWPSNSSNMNRIE